MVARMARQGWGVSSSRRLAGATPEELTAAQACDGIGTAVQVEEEQLRIRRSAAPARGRLGRDRICACGRRHLGQDSPVVGSPATSGTVEGGALATRALPSLAPAVAYAKGLVLGRHAGHGATGDQLDSGIEIAGRFAACLLYTSPSPRDRTRSRM